MKKFFSRRVAQVLQSPKLSLLCVLVWAFFSFLIFSLQTNSLESEACYCQRPTVACHAFFFSAFIPETSWFESTSCSTLFRPHLPEKLRGFPFRLPSLCRTAPVLAELKTIKPPEDASVACQCFSLKLWTHCLQANWCKYWGGFRFIILEGDLFSQPVQHGSKGKLKIFISTAIRPVLLWGGLFRSALLHLKVLCLQPAGGNVRYWANRWSVSFAIVSTTCVVALWFMSERLGVGRRKMILEALCLMFCWDGSHGEEAGGRVQKKNINMRKKQSALWVYSSHGVFAGRVYG